MPAVPDLLTVEEAARVMRIGRTKAYALAREWRTSNGQSGLPVVDIGNVLRVPRQRLEQLLGTTLTTCDAWARSSRSISATLPETCAGADRDVEPVATAVPRSAETPAPPTTTVSTATSTTSRRRHRHARPASQLDLFGTPSPSSAER